MPKTKNDLYYEYKYRKYKEKYLQHLEYQYRYGGAGAARTNQMMHRLRATGANMKSYLDKKLDGFIQKSKMITKKEGRLIMKVGKESEILKQATFQDSEVELLLSAKLSTPAQNLTTEQIYRDDNLNVVVTNSLSKINDLYTKANEILADDAQLKALADKHTNLKSLFETQIRDNAQALQDETKAEVDDIKMYMKNLVAFGTGVRETETALNGVIDSSLEENTTLNSSRVNANPRIKKLAEKILLQNEKSNKQKKQELAQTVNKINKIIKTMLELLQQVLSQFNLELNLSEQDSNQMTQFITNELRLQPKSTSKVAVMREKAASGLTRVRNRMVRPGSPTQMMAQ